MTDNKPDWESFGRGIMELLEWSDISLDAGEVFEIAHKYKIIREVEGGYDPDKHYHEEIDAEKGDLWFENNFEEKQND
jgi:hypothetical protein